MKAQKRQRKEVACSKCKTHWLSPREHNKFVDLFNKAVAAGWADETDNFGGILFYTGIKEDEGRYRPQCECDCEDSE